MPGICIRSDMRYVSEGADPTGVESIVFSTVGVFFNDERVLVQHEERQPDNRCRPIGVTPP